MNDSTHAIASHCPICEKPYGETSTARSKSKHLSYCRRKHQPGTLTLTRRKACDACVRAKVRCTVNYGGCSRCVSKVIPCTYQGTLLGLGEGEARASSRRATPEDVVTTNCFNGPTADTGQVWSNSTSDSSWSNHNTSSLVNYMEDGDHPVESWMTDPVAFTDSYASLVPLSSIPPELALRDSSSLFERRSFSQPESQVSGDLALHILRSYPHTLANQDRVPPFIHPKHRELYQTDTTRPRPLSAAISLSKMFIHGHGRIDKRLVWGLIRAEQDRLYTEHRIFDRWESLEALQSLVIYMLLRIIEGRREYTQFDTQLIISMTAICAHLFEHYGDFISSHEALGRMMTWQDWAFFESRRRTASAFCIINTVLHAQIIARPENMPEYGKSPAPSPMTLWQAENEVDWAADYADFLSKNNSMYGGGMLRNSDLVGLKDATTTAGSSSRQSDRWYAYADSFGLLVTLAAGMVSSYD